ncbi:BA14K family protein [Methylobrevis albus]|uniref:BA14K family protein n=1 Tax=Methylobrevis albus TaxID=2793297 RepID=UPI002E2B1A05|nr:BA14K family protein [Methylobrevis albus]
MRGVSSLLVVALAATGMSLVSAPLTVSSAEARDQWRRYPDQHRYYDNRRYNHRRHYDSGAVVGAGVAGLAVGALLGTALAAPPRYAPPPVTYVAPPPPPVYYEAPPVYYQAPPVVYSSAPPAGGYPAYSAGWYSYCESRYRSFDPQSGTFVGYDGMRHFCQ